MKLRELKAIINAINPEWDDATVAWVDISYDDPFHAHEERDGTITISECYCVKGSNTEKEG